MEPPSADSENVPINPAKEKRKRRSSILKKRASNSPTRTPLREHSKDALDSPSRKKRNMGERRVSFSKAPEVREFHREPSADYQPRISPNPQPLVGFEALMFGNFLANPAGTAPGPAGNASKMADCTSAGSVDMSMTCVPSNTMSALAPRGSQEHPDLAEDSLVSPMSCHSHTIVGAVDMDMTCLPTGNSVLHVLPSGRREAVEEQDMSLTEICLAESLQESASPQTDATCHILQHMDNGDGNGDDVADSDDMEMTCHDMEMTCRDMDATCRQMDLDDSGKGGAPIVMPIVDRAPGALGTGATQNLDMLTLNEEHKAVDAVATGAPDLTSTNQLSMELAESLESLPQVTPAATPRTERALASRGFDETIFLKGAAASTPMVGRGMVAFQTLDETIIGAAIEENLSSVVEGQDNEHSATAQRSLLPAASCVTDDIKPSLLSKVSPVAAAAAPAMEFLQDEEPPSFMEASDADLPPITATPMANLVDCLATRTEAYAVEFQIPGDLLPDVPFDQWTCAQKLFCTFAVRSYREIQEYGATELNDVNSKLRERISTATAESKQAKGLSLPEKMIDAHASHIISKAELEPCGFQTSLLNRFSEQLSSGKQQLDGLLHSLSEQCSRIDEALQLLDNASSEVEGACQRMRASQLSAVQLKSQTAKIAEVQAKHASLAASREELQKCEAERSRLISEKDQLREQIVASEANLVQMAEDKVRLRAEIQTAYGEMNCTRRSLMLCQRFTEWTLEERSAHHATFSFLRASVLVTLDLQDTGKLDGSDMVTSVGFDEQPARPVEVWEKGWYDFGAVLLLDAVEAAHDRIVSCHTIKEVLDLLSPLALSVRLLVEECWEVSLGRRVDRDATERTVSILFSGNKPLHRFTTVFRLPHIPFSPPELVSVNRNFGRVMADDVRLCIAKVPAGTQWMANAVHSINSLCVTCV